MPSNSTTQASGAAAAIDAATVRTAFRPRLCPDKVRIGHPNDGGYVLPKGALESADCLISLGISTYYEFEEEAYARNPTMDIFMFDPFASPSADAVRLIKRVLRLTKSVPRNIPLAPDPTYVPPKDNLVFQTLRRVVHWGRFFRFAAQPRVSFERLGLRNRVGGRFIDFTMLFTRPAIARKKRVILKMDIEGDEFDAFDKLVPFLNQLTVFVCEWHGVGNRLPDALRMIAQLKKAGLPLVHLHGNNERELEPAFGIPDVLELTFARAEFCPSDVEDQRPYPLEGLDAPCNPARMDYPLRFIA